MTDALPLLENPLLAPPPHLITPMVSAAVSGILVLTVGWHGRYTMDYQHGVQKFHAAPTPRIGGLSLYLALLAAFLLVPQGHLSLLGSLLFLALPAFGAGFLEDLTGRVGVRDRLLATILSGALFSIATGYSLASVGIPPLDLLLGWFPFSLLFTAIAIGGVANSVNIIDGFNGLAGGVLIICFTLFGILSWQVGDTVLIELCVLCVLAISGFMVLNFPFGKIFMGDGGAYFMGFMLAAMAVMLPVRNPEVSPWASVVVCAYPLIETLFSMLRRLWLRADPGQPDSLHLHSLIKVRITRRFPLPQYLRNAMVSPFCWLLAVVFSTPVVTAFGDTHQLQLTALSSMAGYAAVYALLLRTKPPASVPAFEGGKG